MDKVSIKEDDDQPYSLIMRFIDKNRKMKYIIIIIAFLCTIAGCCHNEDVIKVPKCISNKFYVSSKSNLKVKQWNDGGKTFFFFNTGAMEHDGIEEIYDDECNIVCSFCGECILPDCLNDFPEYDSEDWKIILSR